MTAVPDETGALLRDFLRDRSRQLPLLALLVTLGALVELAGLLLLIPMLASVTGESGWTAAIPVSLSLDGLSPRGQVLLVGGLFLAVMTVRAGIVWWRERVRMRVLFDYLESLRARYLRGMAATGWSRTSPLGEDGLHRQLFTETTRCMIAISYVVGLVSILVLLAIQGTTALILSPGLSLVALGLLLIGAAIAWPFARGAHRRGRALSEAMSEASGKGGALYHAFRRAAAEGTLAGFVARYEESDRRLNAAQYAIDLRSATGQAVGGILAALAAVVLLVTGSLVFALPASVLIALIVIFARLSAPVRQAAAMVERYHADAPAFAVLAPVVARAAPRASLRRSGEPLADWQSIDVRDLAVRPAAQVAVGPLSFSIARGEWIGIDGPSGAGKTTLVDAIAGLVPARGEIRVDAEPVDPATSAGWADGLAYIGQSQGLHGTTLAEALEIDADHSPAQLAAILAATGVAPIMERLGLDLETPIGARASLLSGGEAQRVAFARALLRHPRLLILDEATAALDPAGEHALFAALRDLETRPAILMVAHRPHSLTAMDRVLSLRDGRLLARE